MIRELTPMIEGPRWVSVVLVRVLVLVLLALAAQSPHCAGQVWYWQSGARSFPMPVETPVLVLVLLAFAAQSPHGVGHIWYRQTALPSFLPVEILVLAPSLR
jgi:hypothetical protein